MPADFASIDDQSEQRDREHLLRALRAGDLALVELHTRLLGGHHIGAPAPLCAACFMGWADCVKEMLGRWPAMASQRGSEGCGPMSWAVRMGRQACVEALIEFGLGDEVEGDGMTSLMWASAEGRIEAVQVLLGARADPLAVGAKGENPMVLAAMGGRVRVLELLWAAASKEVQASRMDLAMTQATQAALEALEMGEPDASMWLGSQVEARQIQTEARGVSSGGSPWL